MSLKFSGSTVGALSLIAGNDDIATNNQLSRVNFPAVAGTVYRIAVDGKGVVLFDRFLDSMTRGVAALQPAQ